MLNRFKHFYQHELSHVKHVFINLVLGNMTRVMLHLELSQVSFYESHFNFGNVTRVMILLELSKVSFYESHFNSGNVTRFMASNESIHGCNFQFRFSDLEMRLKSWDFMNRIIT